MGLVTKMLVLSAPDVAHFMIFMLIFMCGCSVACMAVFGHASIVANTFGNAMESLFLLAFAAGPFLDNYSQLATVNPIMTPMFAVLFLTITALVLLNVFIAILMDAYAEVKPDPKMQATIGEETLEGYQRRKERLMCRGGTHSDVQDVLRVLDEYGASNIREEGEKQKISYKFLRKKLEKPLAPRTDMMIREMVPGLEEEDVIPAPIRTSDGCAKVTPHPETASVPVDVQPETTTSPVEIQTGDPAPVEQEAPNLPVGVVPLDGPSADI